LLEYVYCDRFHLNEKVALELLKVADKYIVPLLKAECEEYLISCLTPKNVVDVSILANELNAVALEKGTISFMRNNLNSVFEQNEPKNLPKSVLFQVCRQKEDILKDLR